MDDEPRYYWRRVCEELEAAGRAVTPAARLRREQLVWVFIERLKDIGAPRPFTDEEIVRKLADRDLVEHEPAFDWRRRPRVSHADAEVHGIRSKTSRRSRTSR